MRSKIAKRILENTPDSVRDSVRKYGDDIMKDTKDMDSEAFERKDEPKAFVPNHPPDYINKEVKKVSEVDLKKALEEVNGKNERDRQEQREATNKALADGFRCGPAKPHDAKRFEPGEHAEIIIQSLRDQLKQREEEMRKAVHIVNEHRHNDLIERDNEIKELKEALREAMQYVGEGYDMLSGTDLEHIREEIELFRDKAKKLLENH
jgi:hypothetical protein